MTREELLKRLGAEIVNLEMEVPHSHQIDLHRAAYEQIERDGEELERLDMVLYENWDI